jgi:hypothetical protein
VVRWFSPNDTITVSYGDRSVVLKVVRIDTDLYLELPEGVDILAVGDRKRLDLDADGSIDLQIQLNSVDTTAGQRKANLGLYKIARPGDEPQVPEAGEPALTPEAAPADPAVAGADATRAPLREISKPVVTLREAEATGPFAVTIAFNGRCLFRFQVDDQVRQERLFLRGGVFELEAERALRLWVSDAGALDIRVAGRALVLGRPGEVAVTDIRWVSDTATRKQQLRAFPLF